MTEDLGGKIPYKNKKVRVKVTYEVECDSASGEIIYENLVNFIDVALQLQNIKGSGRFI